MRVGFPTNGSATNVRCGTIHHLRLSIRAFLARLSPLYNAKTRVLFGCLNPSGTILKASRLVLRASMKRLPPQSPSEYPHYVSTLHSPFFIRLISFFRAHKKNTEEAFDFFKVRNGDKAVLCHQCHKGATDNRPIIPCSVCGLNWHLECLSPPLALPPILRIWRCPCHVDDLLSDLPVRLAPAHKYRKIKNLPVIEQGYSRGLANNGWIEIEEDDSEDDDETAWRENKAFGRVFRVSAKGIKRDFISRLVILNWWSSGFI